MTKALKSLAEQPPGRAFSSRCTMPATSFTAAVRANQPQQPEQQATVHQSRAHQQGPSVQSPSVHSPSLDGMLIIVTAAQQLMTEINGAVSGEETVAAITETVINLMKHKGH